MGLKDKTRRKGKKGEREGPPIEFGRLYRDEITGFEGRATGYCSYISGCDQVLIVPTLDKEGKHRAGMWFDDDRLIDVEAATAVRRESGRGGPEQAPSRTS